MIALAQLEPEFYRHERRREVRQFCTGDPLQHHLHGPECTEEREVDVDYHIVVGTIAEAQGVAFLCPRCWRENNGPIGTHMILLWFAGRGAPADLEPAPARWAVSGTSLADLTLSPSIDSAHGHWHGFVESGQVRDA